MLPHYYNRAETQRGQWKHKHIQTTSRTLSYIFKLKHTKSGNTSGTLDELKSQQNLVATFLAHVLQRGGPVFSMARRESKQNLERT
jgi:hypothetical protein